MLKQNALFFACIRSYHHVTAYAKALLNQPGVLKDRQVLSVDLQL